MVAIQTQDLTGAALDWAVLTAAGGAAAYPKTASGPAFLKPWKGNTGKYVHPSTDWAQGGPIIERENISVGYQGHLGVPLDSLWYATNRVGACGFGQTPLIAALRCFVASKLGPTLEVPEERVP